jgi:hypothetical protein
MPCSLQLLRPEFAWLVEPDEKTKIFDLIGRLIQTLDSPEVAIDSKHTPKLHAKFLAGLLMKHHQDSGHDQLPQPPLPPGKYPGGGNPPYEGQPQPSSTSAQYFGHNPGTTQGTSMPQGGFDNVSYASDPNLSSQTLPSISFPHNASQYHLQTSDGVSAAQDGAVNAMAGLSEEEMLATLRAIGNPNWWSNVMMPGYADLLSTTVCCLIVCAQLDSPGRVRPRLALRKAPEHLLRSSLRTPLCQVLPGSVEGLTCTLPPKPPPFYFIRTTLSPLLHLGHFSRLLSLASCNELLA